MIVKVVKILLYVIVLLVVIAAVLYSPAHWQIRQAAAALPSRAEILTLLADSDRPYAINMINSADQALATGLEMAYPSFSLEYDDGRIFLVDTGMTEPTAVEFGKFLETIANAKPLRSLGSVGDQLGDDLGRVTGLGLTHLHDDHADGARSLCTGSNVRSIAVFQTQRQSSEHNFTTSNGHDTIVAAPCLQGRTLGSDSLLIPVPGYPGIAAYAAAGHTPGSTIFFAAVDDHVWILSGDISNDLLSIRNNLPKPFIYSLFITPEDPSRLQQMRLWLRNLDDEPNMSVVVSHDLNAILHAGVPDWAER